MFKMYTTRPTKVRALQVGESVGELFCIAGAIVEGGGQAIVEVNGDGYSLRILTKDRTNMMRVHTGQWVILRESGDVETLSNDDFEAEYRPE